MAGKSPAEAALQEAMEEAGVKGTALEQCIGHYTYVKRLKNNDSLPCLVAVFPVAVKGLSKRFAEAGERQRVWLSPRQAAKQVEESSLKKLLRNFDPSSIGEVVD